MQALVVHGGCEGDVISQAEKDSRLSGVYTAHDVGYAVLHSGGSALEAVEAALKCMEDNPAFDAGRGSFYNLLGEIEMDALLMDSTGRAGGVACIQRVQYPISVARQVMETTDHVLLVGEGARLFARSHGFEDFDPGTDAMQELLQRQLADIPLSISQRIQQYNELREPQRRYSTVGAVAVDNSGTIVAGTSTGGIPLKLPGRVGDSAIIGAGTYACNLGGASATGVGEGIIRLGITRSLFDRMAAGLSMEEAASTLLAEADAQHIPCGLTALDRDGRFSARHNGYFMPIRYRSAEGDDIVRAEARY